MNIYISAYVLALTHEPFCFLSNCPKPQVLDNAYAEGAQVELDDNLQLCPRNYHGWPK